MSWRSWAGAIALALSACNLEADLESDSEADSGDARASMQFVEASTSHPNGHFRVSVPGPASLVDLEVWPLAPGDDLGLSQDRARLANGRPAPAVLLVRIHEQAQFAFEPRFGLRAGAWYEAVLSTQGGDKLISMVFQVPLDGLEPSTSITGIYPSADVLPENLLRFYVHFSAPMRRGRAIEHVHLFGTDGKEVEGVFLDIRPELWDAEARRLTLLLDPARIKRGMPSLIVDGPNLRNGSSYTLHIDSAWQDSTGTPLLAGDEKEFVVIGPDRTSPDPLKWGLFAPAAGTLDPVRVKLDEPLDRALLERMLTVVRGEDWILSGDPQVGEQERVWEWTPATPWERGAHTLVIDVLLEDRAGNGLARLFDDALEGDAGQDIGSEIHLPFEIR